MAPCNWSFEERKSSKHSCCIGLFCNGFLTFYMGNSICYLPYQPLDVFGAFKSRARYVVLYVVCWKSDWDLFRSRKTARMRHPYCDAWVKRSTPNPLRSVLLFDHQQTRDSIFVRSVVFFDEDLCLCVPHEQATVPGAAPHMSFVFSDQSEDTTRVTLKDL